MLLLGRGSSILDTLSITPVVFKTIYKTLKNTTFPVHINLLYFFFFSVSGSTDFYINYTQLSTCIHTLCRVVLWNASALITYRKLP